MTERKLTAEQIDDLFAFCEEQDVFHYDLQLELVDHLAAAIEQAWQEKPNLTYDDALWSIFGQFGISEFRKVRKAKEKELKRKYSQILKQYLSEFFRLPKIILIIALTLFIISISRISGNHPETYLVWVAIYISFLVLIQIRYKKKYQIDLIEGKSFLLYDYLQSIRTSYSAAYQLPASAVVIYTIGLRSQNLTQLHNVYVELAIAFLISLFSIFLVAISMYIPQRIKEDFTREFPQFVKA